jgi:hypothetical protein
MSFWAGVLVRSNKTLIIISGRKTKMAKVTLSWPPSPADEQVSHYQVKMDDAEIGISTEPTFVKDNVQPGVHNFTVAPVNGWGPGPASDSKLTPPAASKIPSLSITITA